MRQTFDRPFFITVLLLVFFGFLLFTSASLGLLARDGASFFSVAFNQIFLGIFGGIIALLITSKIPHKHLRRYSLGIFLLSLGTTLLVFIPGIGMEFNGATRWVVLGSFSFQPAEFLKLGFVLYFAAWLANTQDKRGSFSYSVIPFVILSGIVAIIMLSQPDTGTLAVILSAGFAMFLTAGARKRDVFALILIVLIGIAMLALMRPYLQDRILTFINPESDPLGSSYQLQQSLIAIGSGQLFGRGFGQSIQKFEYLPEPIGDSIFAVAAEEFGFIGASVLIALFLFLGLRALRISKKAPNYYSGLVVVGLAILIVAQSFINIASMLGVFPLTGLPLLFVSHGGTALFFALLEVGIILSISRHCK